MGPEAKDRLKRWETALFVAAATVAVVTWQWLAGNTPQPTADALRYIDYAVNIELHGVFGLSGGELTRPPPAGNANTPLYPLWLALWAGLDHGLFETFRCLSAARAGGAACDIQLGTLVAAQNGLGVVSLFAIWRMAREIHPASSFCWLTAGLALLSGRLHEYANLALTEILILPLFLACMLFILFAYTKKQAGWMLAAGAMLGLATLTRPSYLYLLFLLLAGLAAIAWRHAPKRSLVHGTLLAAGFVAVTAPWLIRNSVKFDSWAFTRGYGEIVLAQRIAYNRMGWDEIGVAFVHWLPDFGDSLTRRNFPQRTYAKLGWGRGSYYRDGTQSVLLQAYASSGGRKGAVDHLINTEILGNPVKHAAVSVALAWRGMFIGKYWGLVGFLAFMAVIFRVRGDIRSRLIVIGLPAWAMVAFHAGVSVSIPRYNLPLIAPYAIAMACILHDPLRRFAVARLAVMRRS